MKAIKMLVVHPTVGYEGIKNSYLVWRTGPNCSTRLRQSRDYLANPKRAGNRIAVLPQPYQNAKGPRMAEVTITDVSTPAQIPEPGAITHHSADVCNEPGVAYFARRPNGPIKIGFTKDLKQRRKTLRVVHGSDLEILATRFGGRLRETAYHIQFDAYHIGNEWFHPAQPILDEIDAINAGLRSSEPVLEEWEMSP